MSSVPETDQDRSRSPLPCSQLKGRFFKRTSENAADLYFKRGSWEIEFFRQLG